MASTGSCVDSKLPVDKDSPLPCRLLSLPPEIRNQIYELTFTGTTAKGDAPVDLLSSPAPTKSLLLTCGQVAGEAGMIYKRMYRHFWKDNKFEATLQQNDRHNFLTALSALDAVGVNNITSIVLRLSRKDPRPETEGTIKLTFYHGGWTVGSAGHPGSNKGVLDTVVWLPSVHFIPFMPTFRVEDIDIAALEQTVARPGVCMMDQIRYWAC
ncbi:hypothetical protein LTR85_005444 [Meristemomyces frigidus]|nr:hypothetical protein LTR85_005444 [Meristemomyces frigidus]